MDELAIKYQSENDAHREATNTAQTQHKKEVDEFTTQIHNLQVSRVERVDLKMHFLW